MTDLPATDTPLGTSDIRAYLPAEKLRPLVASYRFQESADPLVDFTHPEPANLRFSIAGIWKFEDADGKHTIEPSRAALFGPTDRARRFTTDGGLMMGVELTPIGWLTLIGGDASSFANIIVPLGRQLGVSGPEIHSRLVAAPDDTARVAILDAILCDRPARHSAYRTIAAQVQDAILSGEVEHVAELADHVGVEHRRLLRVCTTVFGFSPMRLLRRQRFLRTLDRMRDLSGRPIGQLIDPGYYDQAHFNRDFKAYMGMTPRAYFRRPGDATRHAGERRRPAVHLPTG